MQNFVLERIEKNYDVVSRLVDKEWEAQLYPNTNSDPIEQLAVITVFLIVYQPQANYLTAIRRVILHQLPEEEGQLPPLK